MAGILRVPRSRGALSGVLLVLLGLWGGLIAFVGPYVDFAFTPNETWVFNNDRLWLNVAPAVATGLGGLIVLFSANRAVAMFGGWLAVLGGAWFVVGPTVSMLWKATGATATGTPIGSEVRQVAEQLAFFTGLGVVIVFFAALALGRFSVVGIREARLVERDTAAEPEPVGTTETSTTQPMARPGATPPAGGRYARSSEPPEPTDQKVAGTPISGPGDGPR
jgi:hypothetical protein